jgi:hypothetical protein
MQARIGILAAIPTHYAIGVLLILAVRVRASQDNRPSKDDGPIPQHL